MAMLNAPHAKPDARPRPPTGATPRPPTALGTPRPAKSPEEVQPSRIVVPVRYAAWLSGDLGRQVERSLAAALDELADLRVSLLPRAILVEADESPGPMLEAVRGALADLEQGLEAAYPLFHAEMGPLWTGTLQSVFHD